MLPLLLVAAFLTLVATVVRALGECSQWDSRWFSNEAGSPMNPFGIVWLVPVFGFLFGRRLAQSGPLPGFVTGFFVPLSAFLTLLSGAGYVGSQFEGEQLREAFWYVLWSGPLLCLLGLFASPRAFVACLAYALLARLPVMLVQYLDIQNGWQTHYGKVHPKLPSMDADERLWLLSLAQGCFWVPFTVLLGCACAAAGALSARRS